MTFTASATDRVEPCPASAVLPHEESDNPYSEAGDARHAFIETAAKGGREAALAKVPDEHREECEALDLSILPTHLAHEVAFALDLETGEARELGRGLKRRYDVGPNEIAGTADVIGVDGERVVVLDYKGPDPNVPAARRSGQLRTLAVMAARAYGKDEALVGFIRFRGSDVRQETAELDMFDLDAHFAKLRSIRADIMAAGSSSDLTPYISEGRHCRWCPAMAHCPAKAKLAKRIEAGEVVEALAPLNPETAPRAVEILQQMEQMTKRVREHVHAYARHEGPIVLGEGRRFGVVRARGQERLDGETAYAVLRELLGDEAAEKAVQRTVTKKGIGDALNGRKGKTKEQERILAMIRERGGARMTSGSEQIKEYTVKREDDAA